MHALFSKRSLAGFDPRAMWNTLIKRTISRFARGNISAQNARVQIAEERAREHARALRISQLMAQRFRRSDR